MVEDFSVYAAGNEVTLRVKNSSPPASLASAIAHSVYEGKQVILRCIGAASINQAVKGVAIARGYVAQRALDIACKPGFITVEVAGEEVTAIILRVFVIH